MTYSDVDQLIFGLRAQITALQARVAAERWGIVTAVSPLTVLQYGDGPGHEVFPDTLVAGLAVGDRVRVQTANLRTLVTGRSGGAPRDRLMKLAKKAVSGGTNSTWAVTFPTAYATVPVIRACWDPTNPSFKGAITVQAGTATGCTIRVDNLGTADGTVGVWLVLTPQDRFDIA